MLSRQVFEVTPAKTILYTLDARTKLIVLFTISLLAILVDSTITLYMTLMLMLVLHFFAQTSKDKWKLLMILLLANLWGATISQGLFYSVEPRTPIITLVEPTNFVFGKLTGGICIYREGLAYGAVQGLRSSIMLTIGLLLCWTTDRRELLKAFRYFKMPYAISFMSVTSLRFLPDILSEAVTVIRAQELRGFKPLKSLNPVVLIKTSFQVLFPILARTIRRGQTLALSVEARGFNKIRPEEDSDAWLLIERIITCSALVFLILLILVKYINWLQFNGFMYIDSLRSVYDFANFWL